MRPPSTSTTSTSTPRPGSAFRSSPAASSASCASCGARRQRRRNVVCTPPQAAEGGAMDVPIQITVHDVPDARLAQVEEKIRRRAEKLERFCDHIVSCRVAIDRPHRFETSGNPYRMRIEVSVPPGHDIVVRKEPGDFDLHTDILTIVNAAFEAAERQLK